MRKFTTLLALVFSGFYVSSSAQDVHFSQFYESPLTLNPALCGVYNGRLRRG